MTLRVVYFIPRKEEGVSINPTFNVSVTFGKRDEVSSLSRHLSVSLVFAIPLA